jgi:hypothetical protein
MRRFCLFLLVSICLSSYGQVPDSLNKKGFQRKLIPDAKTAEKITLYTDSLAKDTNHSTPEQPQFRDDVSGNIEAILQLQKERRAKEKRNAIFRIGIGILFLIVLVIGLSRKRKK